MKATGPFIAGDRVWQMLQLSKRLYRSCLRYDRRVSVCTQQNAGLKRCARLKIETTAQVDVNPHIPEYNGNPQRMAPLGL